MLIFVCFRLVLWGEAFVASIREARLVEFLIYPHASKDVFFFLQKFRKSKGKGFGSSNPEQKQQFLSLFLEQPIEIQNPDRNVK